MPRAKGGVKTRRRHKRVLKAAEGYVGAHSTLYRTAQERVDRAQAYAYRDRRVHKREMRALWQTRIGAAAHPCALSYSRFMHGLKRAGIALDRKVLAELAIRDPQDFAALAAVAKQG
ncbi:MAG: 50S ribosomal protein L20 [Deltaproteobacteria bacterium]|nr:50S ribosomal protein L20 [Deltaproteobacteria bacterium]